jgi:hypothetical protein
MRSESAVIATVRVRRSNRERGSASTSRYVVRGRVSVFGMGGTVPGQRDRPPIIRPWT